MAKSTGDAQQRAQRAKELLEDPIMVEAFDNLCETYRKAWQESSYEQVAEREKAYRMVHALNNVRAQLNEIVLNGRIESSRVKQTLSKN